MDANGMARRAADAAAEEAGLGRQPYESERPRAAATPQESLLEAANETADRAYEELKGEPVREVYTDTAVAVRMYREPGPSDPWPPLIEAVDELVFVSRHADKTWAPMIKFVTAAFKALKVLRRNVRDLDQRTSAIDGGNGGESLKTLVDTQQQLLDVHDKRIVAASEMAAGAAHDIDDFETRMQPWSVRTDERINKLEARAESAERHLVQAARDGARFDELVRRVEGLENRTGQFTAPFVGPIEQPVTEEAARRSEVDRLFEYTASSVVPTRLIPFITDGRFDVNEALTLLRDYESENGLYTP